jgi:NDP-sugar pyrophosphorylase family protein
MKSGKAIVGMKAMILAAGEGMRLRPITETVPKALVEVGGRPLIDYALDTVRRAGLTEVVINLHHLGDLIRDHVGDGSAHGLRALYSAEDPLLGSGGGIVHARSLLGDATFVTLNADTIVDVDLEAIATYHRDKGAMATMVLREDPRMADFGLIRTDAGGRIRRFLDHTGPGAPADDVLEAFMYSGVQVLDPGVFRYMPGQGAFSITAVTYPDMLAADEPLYGYPFKGRWITVGTPAELEAANRTLNGLLDSQEGRGLS